MTYLPLLNLTLSGFTQKSEMNCHDIRAFYDFSKLIQPDKVGGSLYTNDCPSKNDACSIIKYVIIYTVIAGYLRSHNSVSYKKEINEFVIWCIQHYLELTIKKKLRKWYLTWESNHMIYLQSQWLVRLLNPVQVSQHKCLGTITDL